jgi:catechol 2,3-dioxygenase-like lactoylglutathione lyase family enzyme
VVFNVADPLRSVEFYSGVLGMKPERVAEYQSGRVPFPSVRIDDRTILDFVKRESRAAPGCENVDHIALTLENAPVEIRAFLDERQIPVTKEMTGNFGAQGETAHSFHVHDPDGNLLELQAYSGD